jgi:hypothetical protein
VDYEGNSALIAAAKAQSEPLIQLMLLYKVNPDHMNIEGCTAKDYWPENIYLTETQSAPKTSPHSSLSLFSPGPKREYIEILYDVFNEDYDSIMGALTK